MPRNFIIADQSLVNYMGHSFEYAHAIGDYAKSLDYQVTVLANQSVSKNVIEDIQGIPCFRYGLDHSFDSSIFRTMPSQLARKLFCEWNYKCHNQTLYQDLCKAEKLIEFNSETIVTFHTIRHNQILPIIKWAEHISPSLCPWFVLVFHFTAYPNFYQSSETATFYRRALSYLENSSVKDRFRLFTDSQELADEYRDYTKIPVNILPIPHATPNTFSQANLDKIQASFPIRLTYLGDARNNKGFHFLPALFHKLRAYFENGNVDAEIQANVRNSNEWESSLAVSRMRYFPGIKLHDNNLSSADYYSLLLRAGIILLPYTLDYYHSQTSGIFCEALAHGKPVIVPRGSWMAKQLKENGSGITFLPEDRQSLYEATMQAINNYAELKTIALEKSILWRKTHCPATYTNMIIDSID